MRVARSVHVLPLLIALAAACGGNPPPAANAPEASPAESAAGPAASTDAPPAKPQEEEGWAGENAAKSGATQPAPAADATPASDGKGAETRTMEVIRQAVMDNRKAARKCYEDARKQLKDLKGDVTIHFVIDPEGNVKSAELNQERSTLKSPDVVNCVIGVIKGIKFPKSSRAMETSTNYPFNFTP